MLTRTNLMFAMFALLALAGSASAQVAFDVSDVTDALAAVLIPLGAVCAAYAILTAVRKAWGKLGGR